MLHGSYGSLGLAVRAGAACCDGCGLDACVVLPEEGDVDGEAFDGLPLEPCADRLPDVLEPELPDPYPLPFTAVPCGVAAFPLTTTIGPPP